MVGQTRGLHDICNRKTDTPALLPFVPLVVIEPRIVSSVPPFTI